jgi:hypothetical protein
MRLLPEKAGGFNRKVFGAKGEGFAETLVGRAQVQPRSGDRW